MKRIILFILLSLGAIQIGFAQKTLSKLLDKYNNNSVPYIQVQELDTLHKNAILLDSRELYEYNTSHLENAIYVGYDNFNVTKTTNLLQDKDQMIVVYCSLGVRSEDVAEKLIKSGYTNVYNLYGGIFEWKNKELPVYDTQAKETENVHAFSEEWGKWLFKGNKVFDK